MFAHRVTPQARTDFERDGVTIMRGFYSPAEIQDLWANFRRYLKDVVPRIPKKYVFYQDKTRSRDETALLRLERMNEHDPYYEKMRQDMAPAAAALLGEPVTPQQTEMFDKAVRFGEATPPHQDGYYFMLKPNLALTFWIPLERADEGNACVRYIRGSHKRGLRKHEYSGVFGFSLGITDYGPADRADEFPAVVDPGDVIVHHGLTIHRTDPNTSDRTRPAMGLVYYAQRSVLDEQARATHKARIEKEWTTAGKV